MSSSAGEKGKKSTEGGNWTLKLEQKLLPLQNCLDRKAATILTILFISSNLILIGFSSALIGLLNSKLHCDVQVEIARVKPHKNFQKNPEFYVNDENIIFNYQGIFNASVHINAFPSDRKNFWAIITSVAAAVLATSVIVILTLLFFVIVKAVVNQSHNKLAQKFSGMVSQQPKLVKISRVVGFIGAVLQIALFCCMIAVLMAAIVQAHFEAELDDELAEHVNSTLNGIIPPLKKDVTEAKDYSILSLCWVSVYAWIDGDAVVRFGVVLLAVSAFELMSIFTCAALMRHEAPATDEEPLMNDDSHFQYDNAAMHQGDSISYRQQSSKEIELTNNVSKA